jgi:hypothetical protein
VVIVGTLFPKGCNQLFAQFQQADQNESLGGPSAHPLQPNEPLQVMAVGADWLTVHAGPGVANVRWADTAGHRDEMRPVDGWVALAGTLIGTRDLEPGLSLNSLLTAYSASGQATASLIVGKQPLPPLSGNLCQ